MLPIHTHTYENRKTSNSKRACYDSTGAFERNIPTGCLKYLRLAAEWVRIYKNITYVRYSRHVLDRSPPPNVRVAIRCP